MKKQHQPQSGFTLVELAIVIVIIGLLIGGVLVGQDLIKAAQIRNVATQIDKYDAGATTFRAKYNGLPGDLLSTRANSFGLTQSGAVTQGLGDGNGLLENGATPANLAGVGGENALFWVHLTQAGFISESFSTATGAAANAAINAANLPLWLPALRLRDHAYVNVTSMQGLNHFYISDLGGTAASGLPAAEASALTGIEAEAIDSKADDGMPLTGTIRHFANLAGAVASTPVASAAPGAGVCIVNTPTNNTYNRSQASGSTLSCRLRWRTSF